jgi:septum formation protein
VLASGSPRRRELLRAVGLAFEVVPPNLDESARRGETPEGRVRRLAREKALAVAGRLAPPPRLVLGADTVVVLGDAVLGKPADPPEAEAMLARLAGRTHRVLTGLSLVRSGDLVRRETCVESRVRLRAAGAAEIRAYVETGEPLDKAGAYALQGLGRRFVEEVVGSRSNVIGLPLDETLALLAEAAGGWTP